VIIGTIPKSFKYMQLCEKCSLHKTRQNVVVGRGVTSHVTYMFVGEAPGENEDEQGLPFVGRAGEVLQELLEKVKFPEDITYITNIVKCRPPANRPPTGREVAQCSAHLQLQLKTLRPKIVVVVGATSLAYFCPSEKKISAVRGKVLMGRFGLKIYPIIHPAAIFRNPDWKPIILKDLKNLLTIDLDFRDAVVGPRIIE